MSTDSDTVEIAQSGLRQIEEAIIKLLNANPQGLRNVDIARGLGLSLDLEGNQKNQLTYAVLGGLLSRGEVNRDADTKLFTSNSTDTAAMEIAQSGLRQIEEAILKLLNANPQGLRNVEVAQLLDLRSDFQGRQRDYLTYKVLANLLKQDKVRRERRIYTKV